MQPSDDVITSSTDKENASSANLPQHEQSSSIVVKREAAESPHHPLPLHHHSLAPQPPPSRPLRRPLVKVVGQLELGADDVSYLLPSFQLPASSSSSSLPLPPPPSLPPPAPTSSHKLLIVGNSKCGKTSLIRRYASRSFAPSYSPTIGADYTKRDVVLRDSGAHKTVCIRLQLWDIAGQDRFAKMTRAYFKASDGAVIVADLTRPNTIKAVREWKKEIDKCLGKDAVPVILFANKADIHTAKKSEASTVGEEEAFAPDGVVGSVPPQLPFGNSDADFDALAAEIGLLAWFRTCAKDGSNVDDGFNKLVREILKRKRREARGKSGDAAAVAAAATTTTTTKGADEKCEGVCESDASKDIIRLDVKNRLDPSKAREASEASEGKGDGWGSSCAVS